MKEGIRKKIILAFSGLIGGIFLMAEVWGASYVVIEPTKVFQKPSEKAPAVSYLTSGTEVEEVQKTSSGKWVRIKAYKGKVEGWVSLSKLKPKEKVGEEGLCKVDSEVPNLKWGEGELKKPLFNGTNGTFSVGPSFIPNIDGMKGEVKREEKVEVGNVVYVKPNRATMVEMSSLDINRVYCDGEITDVIFSEEKGVRVKIVKNNAFVKFVVKRIEDKEIPVENPVDIFFVCDNQVYSVIAIPKRIPSAFIYLEAKERKVQEVVERVKDLPYEKRLLEVIKAIYLGKYEPNYQVVNVNKEFYLFKDVKVVLEKVIDIEGEGLRAKVFRLETNFNSSTQYVEIKEKDFVRKELTSIPLAVSLDKSRLQGRDKATLIILEKRIVGE
jgi:conjugal transfer pilus assembly protein TraK